MSQSPSQFDVSSLNGASNVTVDVTILRSSFVFGQSSA